MLLAPGEVVLLSSQQLLAEIYKRNNVCHANQLLLVMAEIRGKIHFKCRMTVMIGMGKNFPLVSMVNIGYSVYSFVL